MNASFRSTIARLVPAAATVVALCASTLASAGAATNNGTLPAGGKYHDCHGYVEHVSAANIRVHCVDGKPADLSFVSFPKYVSMSDGRTAQSRDLKPNTPVHVIFTQSLGVRHAYKLFVADPNGHGLYGFKT